MPKHETKLVDDYHTSYSKSPNETALPTNGSHAENIKRSTPGTASLEDPHSPCSDLRAFSTSAELLRPGAAHERYSTKAALGPDLIASVARNYARLTRRRDETSRRRLEAQIALQQSTDLQTWSRKSQHELLKVIRGEQDTWPKGERTVTAYNKAQADSNAADAYARTVHRLQRELSSLEDLIKEKESQFYEQVTSLLRTSFKIAPDQGVADEESEPAQSPILHPLLASYYDKVGDVGICQEDIANLDLDFQEESTQRALLIDQGDTLSRSRSTYDREYKTSRRGLLHRLNDSIHATEVARQLCVRAELEITQNTPDCPDETSEVEDAPPSLLEDGLAEVHPADPGDAPAIGTRQSRVMHWVQEISNPARETVTSVKKLDVQRLPDFQRELDTATFVDVQPPRRFSSPSVPRKVLFEVELVDKHAS